MSVTLNIPYSEQYGALNREGHEHPAPTFGAPTLVWHLAISPHWPPTELKPELPLKILHDRLSRTYEETRTAFFNDINRLLEMFQNSAGYPQESVQRFKPDAIPAPWKEPRQDAFNPFFVAAPGSIRFTLWWSDSGGRPIPAPTPDALRIKVQAAAHRDYVTLSFYLDVLKPWNSDPPRRDSPAIGERRKRVLAEVERIRAICEPRMAVNAQGLRLIDQEILPEHGVSETDAQALMSASQYLYAGVWEDFCSAMGISKIGLQDTGRVFANFRGLVIPTAGLPETTEERPFPGSCGADAFPRFKGNGGIDHTGTRSSNEPNEANAVVKAFWPFIRRSICDADRKEFVACGLMGWRALYVTTLNCPPSYEWPEEARNSRTDIPADHLPEERRHFPTGAKGEQPVHYLLITKGDPQRRQIGRIAERINSMGTMRLIALRDYSIIRDASTQIQLRGQELDTMMRRWSTKRSEVRSHFEARKRSASGEGRRSIQDEEDEEIQKLADDVEKDLIELSAALDEVGVRAVHGLHFRINRSRYYVAEFESLLASLKIGSIDTWVSYDQFVTRGLKPAFDFIDGVGVRLLGLRTRLQSVLEGIETSALVKQSAATRQNTMHLRRIADTFATVNRRLRTIGVLIAALTLVMGLFGLQGKLAELLGWLQLR